MKIVHPKAEIISSKESIMEQLRICEAAGRTCYQSQDKINKNSYVKFLRGIVKSGHLSVIEHLSISARLICSRSCSHQIVRHRLCQFSQASQRYVNMSNPEIILPHNPLSEGTYYLTHVGWKNKETNEVIVDVNTSNIISCIKQNFELYQTLIQDGLKKEDARCLLPNACATEIVMTCNFREWMHVFKERADNKHAQEEIRELFTGFKNKLVELVPEIGEILQYEKD